MEQILIQKKVDQLDKTEILNADDRIFKSWGSVEIIDKDGELLPMDEFKKVMPMIMKRGGNLIDSHSNRIIGKILNYEFKQNPEFNKEGVLLTCQIYKDYSLDNEIWKGIKDGEYTGLSFGGRNKIEEVKFGKNMDTTKILRGLEGYEFSVVQNPANQGATMEEINYLAKSEVSKPFAGFKNFDSCVLEMSKKYDKQTANKVCGKLQSTIGKIEKEFELLKNNSPTDEEKSNKQLIKNIQDLSKNSEITEKYINNKNQVLIMETEITKEDLILKGITEINEGIKELVKNQLKIQAVNEPDGDEPVQNKKPVVQNKKKVKKEDEESEESSEDNSEENSEESSETENKEEENKEEENKENSDKEALDKMKKDIKEELTKEIKKELNISETPRPKNEKRENYINKGDIKLPRTFAEANKLARKLIK